MSATDGGRAEANLALVRRMLEVYAAHDFTKVWQPRLRPVQERFTPGAAT